MSLVSTVLFHQLAELCDKINQASKDRKVEILQLFIEKWRKVGASESPSTDTSFYPVMRLLLPHLDRYRGAYGIKEHTLAKMYIRVLGLPPKGRDAVKLLNYKTPSKVGGHAGDFADVAYWVLKDRCGRGQELSIEDVNNHLDQIASYHAEHKPREIDSELCYVFLKMSALEQKWFIRILLKDMKSDLGQGKVFKAYHLDAKDLFEACNSLQKVCEKLHNPNVRLHEIEVELFSPFRPMLSEECNLEKLESYFLRSPTMYIEQKLDGERFQVHINEGDYKYYSRNGYEYTATFGESRLEGTLTPYFAPQLSSEVKSAIFDGEMMCWNPETKTFTTKGMSIDVKCLKLTSRHQPCLCVFDILFLNGDVLTNKPLVTRVAILEKLLEPMEGRVLLVLRKPASKQEDILNSLNEAIDNCEEGIILKESLSIYKPNARQGGGWFKLKPEYVEGLMDTLDLLIIGGYRGSGRHHGRISHFLVAVVDETEEGKRHLSMSRVGSGCSMDQLSELQRKLEGLWRESPVEGVEFGREKPDLWIDPVESIVLEVKASEIVPSDNKYRTEHTLRFPRIVRIRYDKLPWQCLTLTEFEEKRSLFQGKLTTGHLDSDCVPKQKPRQPRGVQKVLADGFESANFEDIPRLGNVLDNKEICVMGGWNDMSKGDVEQKIAAWGASIVQNPSMKTWCVLAEDATTQRIRNAINSKLYDVAKCSWLLPLLNGENIPDFPPHSLLGMSPRTKERLGKIYDEYGDMFVEENSMESLRKCLDYAIKDEKMYTTEDMDSLESELFEEGFNYYRLFKKCVAFVVATDVIPFDNQLLLYDFRYFGGKVVSDVDSSVTHVFVADGMERDLSEIRRTNNAQGREFHILSFKWISDCLKERKLVDDEVYRL